MGKRKTEKGIGKGKYGNGIKKFNLFFSAGYKKEMKMKRKTKRRGRVGKEEGEVKKDSRLS